jgi:hypothetical protein
LLATVATLFAGAFALGAAGVLDLAAGAVFFDAFRVFEGLRAFAAFFVFLVVVFAAFFAAFLATARVFARGGLRRAGDAGFLALVLRAFFFLAAISCSFELPVVGDQRVPKSRHGRRMPSELEIAIIR